MSDESGSAISIDDFIVSIFILSDDIIHVVIATVTVFVDRRIITYIGIAHNAVQSQNHPLDSALSSDSFFGVIRCFSIIFGNQNMQPSMLKQIAIAHVFRFLIF